MATRVTRRMWVKVLAAEEKAATAVRCEQLIADELKPRFLPEIRPTGLNYPVWHRHTGQWWRCHAAATLDEALRHDGQMLPPA